MSRNNLRPLFENKAVWNRVVKVAESWKGTPYRHLQCVKGRGADCSLFIGAVFLEAGILKKMEHDYYPRDWHVHTKQELVRDGFTKHLEKNLKDGLVGKSYFSPNPARVMAGDVLGFSTCITGATNHASIYLGEGKMIHAIQRKGVSEIVFGSFWQERLTTAFRIFKKWAS